MNTAFDKAIVMISIGARPWAKKCFETFRLYGQKYGFAVEFIDELNEISNVTQFPNLPDSPGRKNKIAYAAKTLAAWHYLNLGYSRVLVVDDTCAISSASPNIFTYVPEGYCGACETSSYHASKSFAVIRDFQSNRKEAEIEFNVNKYFNSGVFVYDSSFYDKVGISEMIESSELLFASHPQQTWLYYLLNKFGVPYRLISKKFNRSLTGLKGLNREDATDKFSRQLDRGSVYISHITGGFKKQRQEIIDLTTSGILNTWSL